MFTPSGYVVQNGEILPVYHSGEAIPREKPDYAVLLKVTKGCFNDPEYDNDLVTFMKLPANEDEVCRAAQEVNAASPKECAFAVVDCTIPGCRRKSPMSWRMGI